MKVVAYLRVSTDRQAEKGYGLDVQDDAVRAWARRDGHRLTAVYRDEGVSGSNGLDTRVGLADALTAVRARNADGVVVPRLDRLARDLVLQETLLAEVKRLGGRVYSATPEGLRRSKPTDIFAAFPAFGGCLPVHFLLNAQRYLDHVGAVVRYLRPEFLDELSESCALED